MNSRPPAGFTPVPAARMPPRAWLALLALPLAGCASGYDVKVDSIARPKAEDAISYEIHSQSPENPEDSLRFKEAAKFIKTALSGKGMYEAAPKQKADMIVDIDYGLGPPKPVMETMSEPVYITIPGRVSYERVQVGTDTRGNPIYSMVMVQEPSRTEYIGDREYQVMVVNYEKYLRMTARDNQPGSEGRPAPEIWTIDVTSEGQSKDLRKYLPAMAAATIEYVGKDTHGQKEIHLKDDKNGAVAFVKKGM